MIRSVGTLYAIQDLFEHLEEHSIATNEFLGGFSKYGTSTAQDVYDTATQLSWVCTAESGQIVPTLIGKEANQGSNRPGRKKYLLQLGCVVKGKLFRSRNDARVEHRIGRALSRPMQVTTSCLLVTLKTPQRLRLK
jgi:hypothetical protein